jgi:hypothetical protein
MADLPDNYEQLTSIEKIEIVHFPALRGGQGYKDTSDPTIDYNCLAWALGINWTRYDPLPHCAGYFWFPGVEREWNEKTIRKIFENHGYAICDSYDLEQGYEKVVFYIDEGGEPQHFARQLENGKWTSKLGELNDIEHDTLESLVCPDYGKPKLVLKRKRKVGEVPGVAG